MLAGGSDAYFKAARVISVLSPCFTCSCFSFKLYMAVCPISQMDRCTMTSNIAGSCYVNLRIHAGFLRNGTCAKLSFKELQTLEICGQE